MEGYQDCDLLLSQGEFQAVLPRAAQTLEWVTTQRWLLDIAIDHLSLGWAYVLVAQETASGDFSPAAQHLNRAADSLRQARIQDYLLRGLPTRATQHRITGAFERGQRDLVEARSVAERGGMRLFQTDVLRKRLDCTWHRLRRLRRGNTRPRPGP